VVHPVDYTGTNRKDAKSAKFAKINRALHRGEAEYAETNTKGLCVLCLSAVNY